MYNQNRRAGGRVVVEPAQAVGAGTKELLAVEPPKESSTRRLNVPTPNIKKSSEY